MATFVVGQDSDTGGALSGPVGRAPVDLTSTWVTSPGDMNATYGSGYLVNSTTRGQVNDLYALGMQQALVVDLSGYPLYALTSQCRTDLAAVVANFDAGGPPFTSLYVVLHDGIENYGASSKPVYLTAPLGGASKPVLGGSAGAWTLQLSYQSAGGSAFPGCPVVQAGDSIYLDEVVGVTGLDTSVTPNLPVDLVGPYVVQSSPAVSSTTTGGVTTTTFTVLIGAIKPAILDTSTTDPSGPGAPFGGRIKIDATHALAHAGYGSVAAYQTALAGVLGTTRTAVTGASSRATVGIGLTGMLWASGSIGIASSVWNTALAGMDFTAANLVGTYSQEATMVTALGNATAELHTTYGKPFMLSWLDIYDPASPLVHNAAHYSNLTTAFTAFINSVFTDPSMTTLTAAGLVAVNFYNDDYLNTQNVGTSYSDLVTKTGRYAQVQHFTNVAPAQPATARVSILPTPTLPATAIVRAGPAPTQPATGRVLLTITPTPQPATATILVGTFAFVPAIARILVPGAPTTQPAGARVRQTVTPAAQPATARIGLNPTPAQPATATLRTTPSAPQPASAAIGTYVPSGSNQPATARLRGTSSSPLPAGAQIAGGTASSQPAAALILSPHGYVGDTEPIDVTFTPPDRRPSFTIYPVETGGPVPDPMCVPDSYEMGITEDLVLPFDPTPLLNEGQTAVFPASTLLNQDTQEVVTLANNPTMQSSAAGASIIVQRVIGGTDLAITGRYRLEVSFTAYPSSNVFTIPLDLIVTR